MTGQPGARCPLTGAGEGRVIACGRGVFQLTAAGLSPSNPALVLRLALEGRRSLLVPETPVTMREQNDGRSKV